MLSEEGIALGVSLLLSFPDRLDLVIDALSFLLRAQHFRVLFTIVEFADALGFILLEHLLPQLNLLEKSSNEEAGPKTSTRLFEFFMCP